ncbi:MAG: DUF1272 domain-containing protein [Roseibium sp.]|uniref:DUF1272 domain-containing protein n=1 Tax=Roseibium sp. TaxID=1936156 RepID=UPI002633D971|nr:DUF1272 domain-containing protein [Roseibium sp.]MCV0425475.1 DUF1272 domain-containing protein [Roseibium sp.]
MLLLKPNCECCGKDLPPQSDDARMCSFECTFCTECSENLFGGICPNCGGEQVRRPRRPDRLLTDNPPSDKRFINRNATWYKNLFPGAHE